MLSVVETRMLRWMYGVIEEGRIRNEYLRGRVGCGEK